MEKLAVIFLCTYTGRLPEMFKVTELKVDEENKVYLSTGEETDIELIEKDDKLFVRNTDIDVIYEFGRGYYPHGMPHKAKVEGVGRYIAFVESEERAKLFRQTCINNPPYNEVRGWKIPGVKIVPKKDIITGVELPADVVEAMKKVETIKLKNSKETKIEKLSIEELKEITKVSNKISAVTIDKNGKARDANGRFVSRGA